jgi:PPOX class probable F420-dependent enzyme
LPDKPDVNREFESALRRHTQVFGSYTRAGELKKVPVWLTINEGRIEFITGGDSLKVKRISRNPRVKCFIGTEKGPVVEGSAEIIRDPQKIAAVYRAYWKTHRLLMLALGPAIKSRVKAGKQVLIRVTPDEPNPFEGITDP